MPQMRQVDQRVSVRCELTALGVADVGNYVRHRLISRAKTATTFSFPTAPSPRSATRSGGVPRVINLICDRALQRGHRARRCSSSPR